MSTFPTRVVLATDGSESAAHAAEVAADIARETGSELYVISVISMEQLYPEIGAMSSPEGWGYYERKARERLDAEVSRIENMGVSVAESYLREGNPDVEVISLAEELGAGLIVVGSRGQSPLRRAVIGSVSDSIVRHAHCPVMVVRGERDLGKEG